MVHAGKTVDRRPAEHTLIEGDVTEGEDDVTEDDMTEDDTEAARCG